MTLNKKALPSAKLVLILGGCAVLTLAGIALSSHFGSHTSFSSTNKNGLDANDMTLEDALTLDSNKNGIADWEESLWGLDPKGNGDKNKAIIDQKKAAAGIEPSIPVQPGDDTASSSPTQVFSQSLLTTILALKQSGGLTQNAIENLGNSIGQNIDSKRSTEPAYTQDDMLLITPTPAARTKYYNDVKALTLKYSASGMGTEFDTIAAAVSDPSHADALAQLTPLSSTYLDFSKDLLALPTPSDAAQYALDTANASAALGNSLRKFQTLYTDALTGMVGLDEYVTANDALKLGSNELVQYFKILGH